MFDSHAVCKAGVQFFTPTNITIFCLAILFIICVYLLFTKVGKKYTTVVQRILHGFIFVVPFLILAVFIWAAVSLAYYGIDDNPPSTDYHPLNALVKQYCIYNPHHLYCPRTAKEVVAIAPQEVRSALAHANVTYHYYPKTNDYTLIIRNDNYHYNNDRAAIFDSRLPEVKGYENQGLDFFDANITTNCDGTYSITNPPPLDGPWKRIN